jgi:hypothetical protein
MSKSINVGRASGKGFFGDLLQGIGGTLGQIGGSALGGLIGQPGLGGQIGGAIGGAIPFNRLPFKKGGVVMKAKKATKAKKQPAKGSKAMKAKMAKLRAMRK